MKQTVNVLVVEDNEYYNYLIFNALQQSAHFIQREMQYKLVLHSFTDFTECVKRIESREFTGDDLVAFVDNNLGNGNNGAQIIKLLKKENSKTLAVLLSQSHIAEGRNSFNDYDLLIIKDTFAPALCRLYLDQYIENKFL
jgi:CheY-like chemotaxis protein